MSKLTNCKACGKEIEKGSVCSNCGKDHRIFFARHKILTGLAVLIIAIIGFVTNAYVAGQATAVAIFIIAIIGHSLDKSRLKKFRGSDKLASTTNSDSK
ncbi:MULTISPECIES: hypothetical protein [Clostridium]|uniref:Zinc-ribbon domain-containing protein n=2 Tax=Clostridium TaxID=1485 RepID=D8GQX1_CLOLD|nr:MULTISPECIES: hypothetical protein [Clostridium]ADK16276.1 hypothetical protein CLJU_c32290 [Clostridium ljungdahlii DSM 13528]AGY75384.1 hypothetical protein CAETHG_1159 [Clostridium autoethanogenum DSM 10061]ALU35550.1 Hypothetical protein CLAU_1121 [Clostridium autoethanogenum DSM 10061]OAA89852.1 hypothetical protein WX45_01690 [Clostridium ljungdahlii DSM 13528]OVY52388.1 hypothetical protein WX72_01286 [Clostridium autoethanogenum]